MKYLCHGYNFQPLAKSAEGNIPIAEERICDTFNGKNERQEHYTDVSLERVELSGLSYCSSSQFSFSLYEYITNFPVVKKELRA